MCQGMLRTRACSAFSSVNGAMIGKIWMAYELSNTSAGV